MRVAAMGIAGVVVALDCAAETLVVPVGVTTNIDVAADTTLTDAVTLTDRSAIEKTGAGKLTLSGGQFTQDKTIDLRVREGTAAFTASPQTLAAYPQPTETMNKAAFWLESRTNLIKDGDDIVEWRDVRDVDPTATNHYYAVVEHSWSPLCPQEATYTNKPAIYFQGYESGCWMNWQTPAGGQATVGNLYHVFLVHGADSRWGYALGQRNGQNPYFQPAGPSGGRYSTIWIAHNAENRPMHSSRTFRDGIELDPFTTEQGTGIHVIEVDCLEMRQSAQCFFNDRDMWKDANGYNPMFGPTSTTQTGGGKRAGGEYICEMLLFTNRLSEVERVSVSNWLLAKWRDAVPPQKPAVAVTLATNTVLEVEGDALASLSVTGDGTLAKTGADMLVMPSLTQPAPRTTHLRVDEGPVTLGQPLPVVCAAGDTVTSAITYAGPQVTKASSAGAGRFVKAGNGPLLLDEVPDGVTNLVVSGGLLTLADPDRKADLLPGPDRNVMAVIPEWDFETYTATGLSTAYNYIRNGQEYQGWHAIVPSDGGSSAVFVFDNTYGAQQHWNLALDTPDGKNCLVVKKDASVWCEFTVPETGEYELEFWAAPRTGYAGTHLDVMIGTGESDLVSVGDFGILSGQTGWRHYDFDAVSLQAGVTYQLWFKSKDLGNDRCTQFDAIRLKKLEAIVGRWAIPNGDFEKHLPGFGNGFTLDNTNLVTRFTVEQCTSFSTTASNEITGGNAYTTFSISGTDEWKHYNRPWSTGGTTQFYMTGNGSKLITTFTPPAGRWKLQADLSTWCVTASLGNSTYIVEAELSDGDETTSLGTCTVNDHRLEARKWPNAFTSDGTTPVTLTLTGTASSGGNHAILDNLVLVAAYAADENLLVDPGINVAASWHIVKTPKPSGVSGTAFGAWDSFYTSYFGLSKFEGTGHCRLVNDDCLYQSVTFPTGGLYRLTVNLKARGTTSPNTGNGLNQIDVYLAKDGVTNLVGRSDGAATTNFNEYAFLFTLPPEGGTYDVGFRGTSVWGGDEAAKVDRTTLVDAAWLCRVETDRDIDLPEHLKIEVAEGARLQLDFAGTNKIDSLRIAGKSYEGLVSAETYPELFPVLAGPGTLMITPKGTMILFR